MSRRRRMLGGLAAATLAVAVVSGCTLAKELEEPQWTPSTKPTAVEEFAVSGYVPLPVQQLPYTGERFVDVTSDAHPVDEDGVAIFYDVAGEVRDHPVLQEQYALSAPNEYEQTGDAMWLDRAVANAQRLIDAGVDRDGAMWFPYGFDWTYYERTIHAPWYSGMAQGSALSLFVRLGAVQPEEAKWRQAADATWASFPQAFSESEPWSTLVVDGQLWFEEYAGNQPPLLVLNGHVFVLYGLYDYYMLTKDSAVARYFDGGATTVKLTMPRFRVDGGVSYYCVQEDYCDSPDWQNAGYKGIHIDQLTMLAEMTGDVEFQSWADLLEADAPRV